MTFAAMKPLALSFALALSALGASAGNATDMDALCAALGNFAERVGEHRQAGGAMSEAISWLDKLTHEASAQMARTIIMIAYDQPQMRVEANRADMVRRLRNDVEFQCYSAAK